MHALYLPSCIHSILVIFGEMENVHDIEWKTSEDVRSGYRCKNGIKGSLGK